MNKVIGSDMAKELMSGLILKNIPITKHFTGDVIEFTNKNTGDVFVGCIEDVVFDTSGNNAIVVFSEQRLNCTKYMLIEDMETLKIKGEQKDG